MKQARLDAILKAHEKWLRAKDGECAKLQGANLQAAKLQRADLRRADVSNTQGLLNAADWLHTHCEETVDGIIAYKTFGAHFPSPVYWEVGPGAVLAEVVNPCRTNNCACGINVATLEWCRKRNSSGNIWRVLIRWIDLADAVVPYGTDGKFRVARCELLAIEDGGRSEKVVEEEVEEEEEENNE